LQVIKFNIAESGVKAPKIKSKSLIIRSLYHCRKHLPY